jgi:ADP-ribose pyrophosphatase YjhB (NUDIX family)
MGIVEQSPEIDWNKLVVVKGKDIKLDKKSNETSKVQSKLQPWIDSMRHGQLWCNQISKMPFISPPDMLAGAALVPILRVCEQDWVVLVKTKTRRFLTVPGGMMADTDISFLATSLRETFEETGLTFKSEHVCPLATTRFQHKYANLEFNGKTHYYYCTEVDTKQSTSYKMIEQTVQEGLQGKLKAQKMVITLQAGELAREFVDIDLNEVTEIVLANMILFQGFHDLVLRSKLNNLRKEDYHLIVETMRRLWSKRKTSRSFEWNF